MQSAHLPSFGHELIGRYTTKSATLSQCDARPTVTFTAAERNRPLAGTKLYCLVTEARPLRDGARSGLEPAKCESQVRCPIITNSVTTPPYT